MWRFEIIVFWFETCNRSKNFNLAIWKLQGVTSCFNILGKLTTERIFSKFLNIQNQIFSNWTARPNPEGRINRKLDGRKTDQTAELIKSLQNQRAKNDHRAEY